MAKKKIRKLPRWNDNSTAQHKNKTNQKSKKKKKKTLHRKLVVILCTVDGSAKLAPIVAFAYFHEKYTFSDRFHLVVDEKRTKLW